MTRKIPSDAFSFYFGLGTGRSYQAVADRFDVSKQAVVKHARKERWQERLEKLEAEAQERANDAALESLDAMNQRHLKTLQAITGKAIEALRSHPLASGMEAVRALVLAIDKERVIRGEPSERGQVDIEAVIKREYESWLERDDQ